MGSPHCCDRLPAPSVLWPLSLVAARPQPSPTPRLSLSVAAHTTCRCLRRTFEMHLSYDLDAFPNIEDVVWLAALLVALHCMRVSVLRAVAGPLAPALMLEALAAAEAAAAATALPARRAFAPGASWAEVWCGVVGVRAGAWALAWAALREWQGRRCGGGAPETGSPAALAAAVAAGEWTAAEALALLWAQLCGAWLAFWYMQMNSVPRPEPNYCPPPLQGGGWAAAALLEASGALAEEAARRGLRGRLWPLRAALHALPAAAAAASSGALFQPALGVAALHACPRRPRSPLPALLAVYVAGPCAGALLGLVAAPALRCAVQKVLPPCGLSDNP